MAHNTLQLASAYWAKFSANGMMTALTTYLHGEPEVEASVDQQKSMMGAR